MFVCPSLRRTLSRKWFESKNKAKQDRQTDRPGHSKWRRGQKRAWHSRSSWILREKSNTLPSVHFWKENQPLTGTVFSSTVTHPCCCYCCCCCCCCSLMISSVTPCNSCGKSLSPKENCFVLTCRIPAAAWRHRLWGRQVTRTTVREFPWEILILQKLERKMVWKFSRTCSVINSS